MTLLKKYLLTQSTIIPVLLIICICAIGMRVSELSRPASSEPDAATIPGSQPVTLGSAEKASAREVAELNLFGEFKQTAVVPHPAEFDNVPKTKLDLILNAVFADSTEARASAVIAAQNNTQAKRYFISEILPGNAVLYAIYPDHVILKRGEQLEKLVFPRDRPE